MKRLTTILGLLCVISTAQAEAENNKAANQCFQAAFDLLAGGSIKIPDDVDTNEEFKEFLMNVSGGGVVLDQEICQYEVRTGKSKVRDYEWYKGQCREAESKQIVSYDKCMIGTDS